MMVTVVVTIIPPVVSTVLPVIAAIITPILATVVAAIITPILSALGLVTTVIAANDGVVAAALRRSGSALALGGAGMADRSIAPALRLGRLWNRRQPHDEQNH